MVRAIDAASDSPTVFHAVDTSCNRSSDAQISLHNLVPTTDSDASHIHCTLNCICKKDYDILYHGTMYHTPLNNTRFSIDAYNALVASIYLHLRVVAKLVCPLAMLTVPTSHPFWILRLQNACLNQCGDTFGFRRFKCLCAHHLE